jgi:hypothetical protein
VKREGRRQKTFHHKDTKINTKGHKEDKRQESSEDKREGHKGNKGR